MIEDITTAFPDFLQNIIWRPVKRRNENSQCLIWLFSTRIPEFHIYILHMQYHLWSCSAVGEVYWEKIRALSMDCSIFSGSTLS